MSFFLNLIQNDYTAILTSTAGVVEVHIKILKEIPPLTTGVKFFQFFNIIPHLHTMVLPSALLAAYPVKTYRTHFVLIATSFPISLFLLMIATPFLMADQFETTFSALANHIMFIRPKPYYYFWTQFIIHGGNLILIFLTVLFVSQKMR